MVLEYPEVGWCCRAWKILDKRFFTKKFDFSDNPFGIDKVLKGVDDLHKNISTFFMATFLFF